MSTQHTPTRQPFLYIIECDDTQKFVKIGMTEVDVAARLTQLQTGCPYQLRLVAVFAVDGDLAKTERHLHQCLSPYQIRGEWFNLSAAQAVYAVTAHLFQFAADQVAISKHETPLCTAAQISRRMRELGVSLSHLAREMVIPKSSLHYYLKGRGNLDDADIQHIEAYLDQVSLQN